MKEINSYLIEKLKKDKNIDLNDSIINEYIKKEFLLNNKEYSKLKKHYLKLKEKENLEKIYFNSYFKFFLKLIKRRLNYHYLMFFNNSKEERENFLNQYLKNKNLKSESKNNKTKEINEISKNKDFIELLKTHKSTYERLEYYDLIFKKISSFFNFDKIDTIVDVACGYNPIIFSQYFKKKFYIYNDLSSFDINLIKKFLGSNNIKNYGFALDIVFQKENFFSELKKFPLENSIFLFLKAFDSFEDDKKNFSLELLKKIILELKAKNFIVSFPTVDLKNKPIFLNRRVWFLNFIQKNTQFKFAFESFEILNEIFFMIKVID